MNDLAGLNWNSSTPSPPNPQRSQSQSQAQYSAFKAPSLPSIPRQQTTPLPLQNSGTTSRPNPRSVSSAKAQGHDSFASLLGPSASKAGSATLSLQGRQKQLLAERSKQPLASIPAINASYHATDAHFWEGLGSGRGTPTNLGASSKIDEDDLLAAFNASATVDASSHFPPPALGDTRSLSTSPQKPLYSSHNNGAADDDDDPFGLNVLASKKPSSARDTASAQNDDDILGMLGKPISEVRRETPSTNDQKPSAVARSAHPQEKAVAELMDMGFDVERSREALLHTEDGLSVQEAVGWLLNQAHEESRNKVRPHAREPVSHDRGRQDQTTWSTRDEESADPVPQWMRKQEIASRTDNRSPASSEKDVTQYAAEIGVSFLKSANSLWRTGQKKVQKVVTELNYESDGSQPKWMRDDRQADSDNSLPGRSVREQKARAPITPDVTDEAMMLESGGRPPKKHQRPTPIESRLDVGNNPPLRRPSPLMQSDLPERRASRPQVAQSQPIPRAPERVSRQLVEEQSAEAYVSPARRRKAPTKPLAQELDMDIFSNSEPEHHPPPPSLSARATPQARPQAAKSSTPLPVRPKAPSRTVPDLSSSALSTSTARRLAGTASFKRGDYAEAHSHYTAALSPLPSTHPIAIVVRCNRALTNIKVGDPKAAILDADAALEIIGSSRGEDETLSLGNAEGDKPMKEFYGKALSRKAEALEAMEKWSDAANIWREAVEAGVGGSVAIQGRNRCEKASGTGATRAAPKPKPVTAAPPRSAPARKATAVARPSATNNLNGGSSTETEAVKRLREANAAAEAASDEAFALTDVVDARLTAWKGGKADNLRALLASLDSVLWSDAGWKKVGMADLVIASRVKIIYMKAIAKVHPDKISQAATVEQKMISASVFATLNEAWDKFKKDNGL